MDLTAIQTAHLLDLDRKTVNRYYGLFRAVINAHQRRQIAALVGVIECDESYFGAARRRGVLGLRTRGRGTNKQPVFGIFERGGAVFTEIVPDVKAKTLQSLIRGEVSIESVVMTDGWQAYDGLGDVGYDKHFRIKKYRKEGSPFTDGQVHVNGIEVSGRTQNGASPASTASKQTSTFTSKNVSGDGVRILIRSSPNYANYWSRAYFLKPPTLKKIVY